MITITIALVIILAIAFVVFPVFQQTDELDIAFVGLADPTWENLVTQRDAMYGAIEDLENEHTMGKLSDPDYRSLRAKYETKAVAILQELDSLVGTKPGGRQSVAADDEIERDVMRLRRASTNARQAVACGKCGTPYAADDVFCIKCGAALKALR